MELAVEVVTPVLEEPDLEAEVERLLTVLPERFALGGLSLGAVVAMALVRRAPQRVSRLALLSTNPYPPTPTQRATWTEQRRLLASRGARGLQATLLPDLLSPVVVEQRPDLIELTLTMAEEVGDARYDAQLRLQGTRADERPGLARIRCPTLVLSRPPGPALRGRPPRRDRPPGPGGRPRGRRGLRPPVTARAARDGHRAPAALDSC